MGTDAPSVNDGISVGGQAISRNDAPGWPLTAKRALPGDGPSATAAHSHAEDAMYPPHGGFREAAEVLGDKGDVQQNSARTLAHSGGEVSGGRASDPILASSAPAHTLSTSRWLHLPRYRRNTTETTARRFC